MNNNYISAWISGGIGNQLIQISITLEYARKYNKTPIFYKDNSKNINGHSESIFNEYRYGLNIIDDINIYKCGTFYF